VVVAGAAVVVAAVPPQAASTRASTAKALTVIRFLNISSSS
jgi:hypothetical protein